MTGNAASNPKSFGFMLLPTSAPRKVPKFQQKYKIGADTQNAVRRKVSSLSAVANAVVSSMTNWAPIKRDDQLPPKIGDMASPYTALRADNKTAPPKALAAVPPADKTLIADIWDAPVNTSKDIAHVCNNDAPADTASTPNEAPNTIIALPITSAALINRRACGARK